MSNHNQAPNIALQLAEYSPPSRCCNHFPGCHCHTEASRDRILRDLQNASEVDLSSSYRRFIPRGSVLRILDSRRVAKHLETLLDDIHLSNQLGTYISPGQEETCNCHDNLCTGSRIIFASLLRIGKEDRIVHLYNQSDPRVCDNSLPLSEHRPFPESLNDLTEKEKQLFEHAQWQLRAHYLKRLEPEDQTPRELDDEAALPLLNVKERPEPIIGELSIVQRIRVDPDHHNLDGSLHYFALKTVKRGFWDLGKDRFQEEFIANQQAPRHDRIVPLLAAFTHRNKYHLIFPYASGGNLVELWETYSSSEALGDRPAAWYSSQWLLKECLGIAESLAATHQPTDNTGLGKLYNPAPQLHADIKPRNILCFETVEKGKQSFTLKLADFGFARKVNEDSTLATGDVSHTKTYRPPEYDLEDLVHLNYDVWCLGCVYLEFITWAVLGWSEVENFCSARLEERDDPHTSAAKGEDYEDTFFRKVARAPRWYDLSGLKFGAERDTKITSKKTTSSQRLLRVGRGNIRISCKVKESVTNHISKIRSHAQCVPEFREFLNFIETKMLVINAETRTNSDEVEIFLRNLTG
ncbi:kinase-like protein [Xylariaceae sp. AK1471]|nr:kinase-like protein [Xylariaceae sp. AK1471]